MPSNNMFDRYLLALRKTPVDEKTEHTDRGALQILLQAVADASATGVGVQHEPKRVANKGAPDFKITKSGLILGYSRTRPRASSPFICFYEDYLNPNYVAEEDPMSRQRGNFTGAVLIGAVYLAGSLSFSAMAQGTPPNFAPDRNIGWYAYNRIFIPPEHGAGPVQQDPTRPYVSNDEFRVTGRQPTQHLADLNNPILQPWARDVVRNRNELVLSGKLVPSPTASCWPKGVTGFLLSPMTQPMFFIQGSKEVVMILSSFNDARHIHLTDKHSANVKISWYGESIGHYEGDTLVVDTIGLDDRTPMDGFGTPHTKQLHVIERFHLIEDGKVLEANIHIEDPGAFTMPWDAIQRFRQYEAAVAKVPVERLLQLASAPEGPLVEMSCSDNPNSFFPNVSALPIPQAVVPDF